MVQQSGKQESTGDSAGAIRNNKRRKAIFIPVNTPLHTAFLQQMQTMISANGDGNSGLY